MKAYKRNGRWTVSFWVQRPDGRKLRIRKASPINKKAAALKFGEALQAEEQQKLYGKQVKEIPTLETFSVEFLDYQRTAVREATHRSYEYSYRKHILPVLGSLRLNEIDAQAIDRFRVHMTSKGLADGSVNNRLAHLQRGLSLARKWGLIRETPHLEKIRIKESGRVDFLTYEECEVFASQVAKENPIWHAWFMLGIRAGLRVGESLGLQWGDIDFINKRIYVSRSWSDDHGIGPTKSGKSREVPLAWDLAEALESYRGWLAGQRDLDADTWVFPCWAQDRAQNNRGPVRYCVCRRFLGRVSTKIGMRRVTPHMLRHTFGSHSAMKGVPMRVLQAWMGHASIEQTMVYSHLSEDVHGDFINRIASPRPEERAE